MIRFWVCGAALATAAMPVAASAQLGDKLDCAVERAEPPFKNLLAEALIGDGDNLGFERLLGQFSTIADSCAAGFTLDDAQKKAYLDYGVSSVLREWLIRRLASYGLSATAIDTALDFGPGRSNPRLSGEMSEDQVKILVQAFMEDGVDTESLSSPAWESVGTYAAVSSIYWRQRQALSAWTVMPLSLLAAPESAKPAPAEQPAVPEPVVAVPSPSPAAPAPVSAPEPVIPTPPVEAIDAPVPELASEPVITAPPPTEAVPEPAPEPVSQPTIAPPPLAEASPAPVPEPTPEPVAVMPPPAEAAPVSSPEPAPSAKVRSSPEP